MLWMDFFCTQHRSRFADCFHMAIVSLICTVVGFILGLFFSEYLFIRSQRASRHLANVTMSRPVPFVRKFPVVIDDGSNIQIMPAPGRYGAAFSRTPFSFYITPDGSINLYGEIRDAKGAIVVEATGDSIRVVQVNKFDINSDSKAIEVVDSNQHPLFQLVVIPYEAFAADRVQRRSDWSAKHGKTPSLQMDNVKEEKTEEVIRLSYVTQRDEKWLVSSPHWNEMVESIEKYDWSKIPRLFCYPGHLNPGKRLDQKGK